MFFYCCFTISAAISVHNYVHNTPHNSVHNIPHNSDDEDLNDPAATLLSKLDLSHPLHLHSNDSAALTVVSVKLNGTENYQVWSCVMLLALEGKIKLALLMVLVLHHKIHTLCQNGSSIADYYHKLNALWKQFNALVELPICTCHAANGFKKHNQLMKLMHFLMGFGDTYMQIRSSILSRETLLDVRSAYDIISNENPTGLPLVPNNIPRPSNTVRPDDNGNRRTSVSFNLICENCGFNGHTIDRCFKIIGYPPDFGKKKAGQNFKGKNVSNNVVGSSSSSGFFDEQLSTLISLIKENSVNGKGVNMPLTNYLTLFDVLVVPGYCVNLMSVHKFARDSKLIVAFDELKLGHPTDQVLNVLRPDLLFENDKSDVMNTHQVYGAAAGELRIISFNMNDTEQPESTVNEYLTKCIDELKDNVFLGNNDENTLEHISNITSIVNLFQSPGVSRDQVMLMAFPFTLKGKARLWITNCQRDPLRPGTF
ncbi:ribonuclease H-like domain-containing protein [Tanacetum coccineum]|uniref:Ribonuclease H-like domain-containing protein n=1 Tax=Tanacetum coccineum TaxID=301880 RepID=A0ABQ5GQ78_9ASTR